MTLSCKLLLHKSLYFLLSTTLISCYYNQALSAAAKIGYPVLARAAFALGGLGSGFADDDVQLAKLAKVAFAHSTQLIIGEYMV